MKTMLKLAAVAALLAMLGGAVTLQSAIKDARAEQQELSKANTDTAASAAGKEKSGVPATSDEVLRLREANKDLPKLRNEVRQLRRQADEMTKLRAANEKLKSAPQTDGRQYPPDYIRRAALVDAGLATPEAAVQTFFWSMTRGNFQRFKDCLGPDALAKVAGESGESFHQQSEEGAKMLPGFRIAGRNDISPGEVELNVELMPGVSDGVTRPMKLKQVGNDWKLEGF